MSDTSEAIATLPFVRNKPGGKGRQFWHVTPTGDSQSDYALGHGYANLALGMASATRRPELVAWVIAEMGRNPKWRRVELGFVRGVSDLALVTIAMTRGNPLCACAALVGKSGD